MSVEHHWGTGHDTLYFLNEDNCPHSYNDLSEKLCEDQIMLSSTTHNDIHLGQFTRHYSLELHQQWNNAYSTSVHMTRCP